MLILIRGLFATVAGTAAGRIQPHSYHEGELTLIAADERWLSGGRDSAEDIRRRLNRLLGRGVVKRIVFKLGKLPKQERPGARPKREIKNAAPPRDVAETAAIIGDERTRKAFLELAASVAALRSTDKERK
ncbi:MAG TPA: hypothetical protein VMX35_15955 [Acidobacteriota bacterium]|nr:hypothetical protein [Acidobacteriota bacterium]